MQSFFSFHCGNWKNWDSELLAAENSPDSHHPWRHVHLHSSWRRKICERPDKVFANTLAPHTDLFPLVKHIESPDQLILALLPSRSVMESPDFLSSSARKDKFGDVSTWKVDKWWQALTAGGGKDWEANESTKKELKNMPAYVACTDRILGCSEYCFWHELRHLIWPTL